MTEGCGRKIGSYDCCTIITGDAKELAKAIPDESVDLIFTDPVYDRIEDYRWLAETAARVLNGEGQALIYQAHKWLPETMVALSSLTFVWVLAEHLTMGNARYWPCNMSINWRPLLWYTKNRPRPFNRLQPDLAAVSRTMGNNHKWHKFTGHVSLWLEQLTDMDAFVFDPFCGGGTVPAVCKMLGRHYLAFEIDPDMAERARERVRNTQPPLFVMEPEQQEMDL